MLSLKELKGGKQIFRHIMPAGILRRLSRSLSTERKRKNSVNVNRDNSINRNSNQHIKTNITIEEKDGKHVRKSKRAKSQGRPQKERCAVVPSNEHGKERKRFWGRSSSRTKKRIPLDNDIQGAHDQRNKNDQGSNGKEEVRVKTGEGLFQSDAEIPLLYNAQPQLEMCKNEATTMVLCKVCRQLYACGVDKDETLTSIEGDVALKTTIPRKGWYFTCTLCQTELDLNSTTTNCEEAKEGEFMCVREQNYPQLNTNLESKLLKDNKLTSQLTSSSANNLYPSDENHVEHKNDSNKKRPSFKLPFLLSSTSSPPPSEHTPKPDLQSEPLSTVTPQKVALKTDIKQQQQQLTPHRLSPKANSMTYSAATNISPSGAGTSCNSSSDNEIIIMTTLCHVCEEPVDSNSPFYALFVMGRLLHTECYICCRCGQQPKPGQNILIENRKVVCCDNSAVRTRTCQGCLKLVMPGELTLSAVEKTWHRLCFRCSKCNIVISDEFFFKDNLQHCLRCYKKYCDVTCLSCDQLIIGKMITTANKRYHPKCAFCSVCGANFKDGQQMLTEGDEIWHPKCSTLRNSIRQMETFITGTSPKRPQQLMPPSSPNREPKPPLQPQSINTNSNGEQHLQSSTVTRSPRSPQTPAAKINTVQYQKMQESEPTQKTSPNNSTEVVQKCLTNASYLSTESNKRLITTAAAASPSSSPFPSPTNNQNSSTNYQHLSPSSSKYNSAPSPEKPTTTNNKVTQALANILNECTTESEFVQRFNQYKQEHQSAQRGGRSMKLNSIGYTNRRKMAGGRHVLLEPTILESELEHETIDEEGQDISAKSDTQQSVEDKISISNGDNKSICSNSTMSSNESSPLDGEKPKCSPSRSRDPIAASLQYPYSLLKTTNQKIPPGIDRKNLEKYLSSEEFFAVFKCGRNEFYKLPKWRRDALKKQNDLF